MRFDGIACSRFSVRNNTYYQLGLEIANCKIGNRSDPKLTCHGLLFSKDDFSIVKDYLHRVMILGLNGVWIKTTEKELIEKNGEIKEENVQRWYHWRWFIGCIPADTVAQEQLIGEPNKKLTSSPCLYEDERRMRLCYAYYGIQPIPDGDLQVPFLSKVSIIGQPLDKLHPNSLYRCLTLIYHCGKLDMDEFTALLHKYGLTVNDQQKEEIKNLRKFYSLFGDNWVQYLPITLTKSRMDKSREKVASVMRTDTQHFTNSTPKQKEKKENLILGNVLVPTPDVLCLDAMHNVSNICILFIRIINDDIGVEKQTERFFNSFVSQVPFGGKDQLSIPMHLDKEKTLCPSFSGVLEKAKIRMEKLKKMLNLRDNLLELSHFKNTTTHNGILFLTSFYNYLFIDSMNIPFIFLFKIIFDYLIDFFNVNYDMKSIVEKQRNLDIVIGLIQNEVLPFYIKYSLMNALYYLRSILNCGDCRVTCSYLSESGYSNTTNNVYACGSPGENASRRLILMALFSSYVEKDVENIPFKPSSNNSNYFLNVLGIELNKDTLTAVAKCNLYDEYMYYVDSLYDREIFADILLQRNIGVNTEGINSSINEYLGGKDFPIEVIDISPILYEMERTNSSPRIIIDINDYSFFNGQLFDKRLAYTRTKNGRIVVFYIIGFVDVNVYQQSFINVLCLEVPYVSGSSLVNTPHYGFLNIEKFTESLDNPKIYLISKKRLHIGSLMTYNNEFYEDGLAFTGRKTIVGQYLPLGDNIIFQEIKKSLKINDFKKKKNS